MDCPSLLEWLAKEDSSPLGECQSPQLSTLVQMGFARVIPARTRFNDAPVSLYSNVVVTEAGHAFLETYRARQTWEAEQNKGT